MAFKSSYCNGAIGADLLDGKIDHRLTRGIEMDILFDEQYTDFIECANVDILLSLKEEDSLLSKGRYYITISR